MTPKQNHRRIGVTSSKKPKTASRTAKRRPSAIEDPELPESGSVGDTSRLSSKNLPYPRIISDLQLPAITKDSMWTRGDKRTIQNADYDVIPVWMMGNLVVNNRRRNGVLKITVS